MAHCNYDYIKLVGLQYFLISTPSQQDIEEKVRILTIIMYNAVNFIILVLTVLLTYYC